MDCLQSPRSGPYSQKDPGDLRKVGWGQESSSEAPVTVSLARPAVEFGLCPRAMSDMSLEDGQGLLVTQGVSSMLLLKKKKKKEKRQTTPLHY